MGKVTDCQLMDLVKIVDARGNLTFIEGGKHIPFEIKRIYYLYDLPTETHRGGHAHKELFQLLICMSGSLEVLLDDGFEKKRIRMSRPDVGLYITPGIWRELEGFSSNSVCLVLASEVYDESDYCRDYQEFILAVSKGSL